MMIRLVFFLIAEIVYPEHELMLIPGGSRPREPILQSSGRYISPHPPTHVAVADV